MCLPVSRTPKPGFPASGMTQMELPGRSDWGSALGTRGGRCSRASIPSPKDLMYANAGAIRPGTIADLIPPQAGEGESPRSHPSPLLKLLKEGLPA